MEQLRNQIASRTRQEASGSSNQSASEMPGVEVVVGSSRAAPKYGDKIVHVPTHSDPEDLDGRAGWKALYQNACLHAGEGSNKGGPDRLPRLLHMTRPCILILAKQILHYVSLPC